MNTEVTICVCKHLVMDEEGNLKPCGHRWIPRSLWRPAKCPKCQSRKWDEEVIK